MIEREKENEVFFMRMAANLLEPCSYDEEKAWEKIRHQTVNKAVRKRRIAWLKYVAVFVGGIGVTLLGYWMLSRHQVEEPVECVSIGVADQQAELILASGRRVILEDSLRGHDIALPGMSLRIDSVNRRLECARLEKDGKKMIGFNTLRVPKGGEYSLILADGTQVWLNAESALRFPVAFEAGSREVYLEGEAFFNVHPDADSPFHVYAAGRDVCVLGTSFNVSAYGNDPYFRSTLVTGKVKVSGGTEEVVLQPSQQYSENRQTGKMEVKVVDTGLYTSWMDGKIFFKSERLEDIVNKLKRWFDFEIFYANEEAKDMRFRGVINKYDSFETALKNLEQTTDIRFSIQGTTVVVRKIYNNH